MSNYKIVYTSRFKKDFKLLQKSGYDINLLEKAIKILSCGDELPIDYKDHQLKGDWLGHRSFHLLPDWIVIYRYYNQELIIELTRTGTHSNLYKK